jgi:hypothetical protein
MRIPAAIAYAVMLICGGVVPGNAEKATAMPVDQCRGIDQHRRQLEAAQLQAAEQYMAAGLSTTFGPDEPAVGVPCAPADRRHQQLVGHVVNVKLHRVTATRAVHRKAANAIASHVGKRDRRAGAAGVGAGSPASLPFPRWLGL